MVGLGEGHVANDGKPVRQLGLLGQPFADVHAGDVGADGAKFTTNLRGGAPVEVVDVDMAGAAFEPDHDDRLAAALLSAVRLKTQQIGESQAANPEPAGLQEARAASRRT